MKLSSRLILLVAFSVIGVVVKAQSVSGLLQSVIAYYDKATSIVTTFSMQETNYSFDGRIITEGDKFVIETPQAKIWYNGQIQWTYSSEINEVNITEPTDEELQQVNPLAIISSLSHDYSIKLVKQTSTVNVIELNSMRAGIYIKRAVLELNKTNNLPTKISLTLENGANAQIIIKNIEDGKHLPSAFFEFDSKEYPNIEIIDLR